MNNVRMCEKDRKYKCILRINKNLPCCIDDINEERELLHPSLDIIIDAVENNADNKLAFSKLMFVSEMILLEDDLDYKIQHTIKSAAYFCYNTNCSELKDTDMCQTLGKSFINETLKWYNHKLFGTHMENKELYLTSLNVDLNTIQNILSPSDVEEIEEDLDDIFF